MNNRERAMAILHYQDVDRLPIVHFGFWYETLQKWHQEGHLTEEEAKGWFDGNAMDRSITEKLGFDFNWSTCFSGNYALNPYFEEKIIGELPDGGKKKLNSEGVVVLVKDGIRSIPMEIDHLLKDRESWETHFLPRLEYTADRISSEAVEQVAKAAATRDYPLALHLGSLYGNIRNWLGVEGLSYLYCDDEGLYDEIINTVGELCFKVAETTLAYAAPYGKVFDYAHFWEDICFKNGPLVNPRIFAEKVGPHYKKLTELVRSYGIDIVSLDCDGVIDALIPVWLVNGVNTMFPIEVGTWNANIAPWRARFGKELRGVGGMDKRVFAYDYAAVDREIERLKPLIALGGYIPCPDHRIPPDAKWENVQYYCYRMRETKFF